MKEFKQNFSKLMTKQKRKEKTLIIFTVDRQILWFSEYLTNVTLDKL